MRRAGEGVDNAQWGGMVALKKKDEESEESADESGPEIIEKQEKAGEAKKKGGKQVGRESQRLPKCDLTSNVCVRARSAITSRPKARCGQRYPCPALKFS